MGKLPSLNGLRALSIILVISDHLYLKGFIHKLKFPFYINDIFFVGNFGVNIFFIISGFLITSLLIAEEEKNNSINLKNFYIRRTLRIFPAYYFLLLVYFILEINNIINIPKIAWLTSITYTKYFFNNVNDWYTGHTWSLCVEEHFYLFWPFLFTKGKRFRNISLFILILVPIFYRFYLNLRFPDDSFWSHRFNIFSRIDAIAFGCLFAIYKERILEIINKRWNLVLVVSFIVIMIFNYFDNKLPQEHIVKEIYYLFGGTYGTVANLAIACIMIVSVFGPKSSWWYIFLNNKYLNYIGILSYSIYLWQEIFINDTSLMINHFPLNLLFIPLAALFSYYVIEKPFLKLKAKY